MSDLEIFARDLDAFDSHLSRRSFLHYAAMLAVVPAVELKDDDRDFLRRVAGALIPAEAFQKTGIDVVANIEHLLDRGSAEHRAKIRRLLVWARRVSFLYGGDRVALQARNSRFVLMQKMSKALSALCLVAFWGDERSLALIDAPPEVI